MVFTFRFCHKRRRTAAIQVHRFHAAKRNHCVSHLLRRSAARPRLLPSVNRHDNYLVIGCDTNTGSGGAAAVIIGRRRNLRLPILNQQGTTANCFLAVIAIVIPRGVFCYYRRAVFQNCKEIIICSAAGHTCVCINNAFHHKCTGRLTIGHCEEVCIRTEHYVIVLNVMLRIIRIGMLALCGSHLI